MLAKIQLTMIGLKKIKKLTIYLVKWNLKILIFISVDAHNLHDYITIFFTVSKKILRLKGSRLWFQQFVGLFIKRVMYSLRKWKLALSQVIYCENNILNDFP